MSFFQRYTITPAPLASGTKRRSGTLITPGVKFIVAHDTGNPGSTAAANVAYYRQTENDEYTSAHLFVDDQQILESIPCLTVEKPEKAWHVRYNVPLDNERFGFDANDAAIGVEYCYGGVINPLQAYRRYVWVIAYICSRFGLDPHTAIVGHIELDPSRRIDPIPGLKATHRTFAQFIADVASEYEDCLANHTPRYNFIPFGGSAVTNVPLKIRHSAPTTQAPTLVVVPAGTVMQYVGLTDNGESVAGNAKWYRNAFGNYFWSGGTVA